MLIVLSFSILELCYMYAFTVLMSLRELWAFRYLFQRYLTKYLGNNRCSGKFCWKRSIHTRKERLWFLKIYKLWRSNSDTGCVSHLEKNSHVYMCELSEENGDEQNSRILPMPHENIPYARNYARTVESWMRPSSILREFEF